MLKKKIKFLKEYNALHYNRPSVTTDILVFTIHKGKLKILLIKRKNPPYQGAWAIPGGFIEMDEDLEESALRELKEETGVEEANLIQLHAFGKPNRDPRMRVITVAYITFIPLNRLRFKANSDAKQSCLVPVYALPKLAFDHSKIINFAIKFIKNNIFISDLLKPFLHKMFTLRELWDISQIVINKKRNYTKFSEQIIRFGILQKAKTKEGKEDIYSFR